MIFLRNRLADYEVYVAELLPASAAPTSRRDRSRQVCIENYDGAPAIRQALEIMVDGLRQPGHDRPRRASRQKVLCSENYASERGTAEPEQKTDHWWKFW